MKTKYMISSRLKKASWVAAALLGAALITFPIQSYAGDDSWKIALSLDIPGKNEWNTCGPYAKELYNRLTRAGGEAYIIVFNWTDENRLSDRHAMVIYRDAKGRYWGMDNRANKPVWLQGSNPSEWVSFFSRAAYTSIYTAYFNPANYGQYADLSRVPRRVVYVSANDRNRVVASR